MVVGKVVELVKYIEVFTSEQDLSPNCVIDFQQVQTLFYSAVISGCKNAINCDICCPSHTALQRHFQLTTITDTKQRLKADG